MNKVKPGTPFFWRRTTGTLVAAIILILSSPSVMNGAEAVELGAVEHYVADGQQFELKRITGEITAKIQADKSAIEAASEWAVASGKAVEVARELAGGAIIYRIREDDSLDQRAVGETMNLLLQDETVRYAYLLYLETLSAVFGSLEEGGRECKAECGRWKL